VSQKGKDNASNAEGALVLLSRDLFCASRTVFIEHDGQRYLLRLTKENKLILTK
jgi:hemin uptake protein HemP